MGKNEEPELYFEDLTALWELEKGTGVALHYWEATHHPSWMGEHERRAALFHTQRAYCDALVLPAAWFAAEQKGLTL